MNDYEARRLENIKNNQALLAKLDIKPLAPSRQSNRDTRPPATKKRKLAQEVAAPTRASARLASSSSRPNYNDDTNVQPQKRPSRTARSQSRRAQNAGAALTSSPEPPAVTAAASKLDIESIRAGWSAWTPAAPAPARDASSKQFHFATHPAFAPNKSPEEMLREGVFGGAYFRPVRSRALGVVVAGDWRELPAAWVAGLDADAALTRAAPAPEQNKFGVTCGQSIEEWEAAGWIAHAHDVRGWFQWYARFFAGRRCDDDERQVGRWLRCVGPRGRWRRALLKAYVRAGVRTVWDDGEEEEAVEVSPVMHQTCLQWAWEIRQDELDEVWERGGV